MAAMLKSDGGEGKDVEMKEVCSPTELSGSEGGSTQSMGADNGAAPKKEQPTKVPPTTNDFLRDSKVHSFDCVNHLCMSYNIGMCDTGTLNSPKVGSRSACRASRSRNDRRTNSSLTCCSTS